MIKINKIAVIGLGYVGLPLALELSKKFQIIGYDIDKKRIKSLQKNIDFTNEISNRDLKKYKFQLTYNKKKLNDANIFIITLPTSSSIVSKPKL